MYFGDLWNFLDLSYRFYKSPQLLLTQLLQCSIARRAPSKTVSFFLIDDIAFKLFTNLQMFLCHNAAQFCILTFSRCFLL